MGIDISPSEAGNIFVSGVNLILKKQKMFLFFMNFLI
jgi:hypothetical protein